MAANKTVFFMIGILLVVLGASMLAPYAMQIVYNENSHSFISSSFVTIFIGILFILTNLEKEFKLNLKQTFLFSTLLILFVKKSEHACDIFIIQVPNARGFTFRDMIQRAFFSLN